MEIWQRRISHSLVDHSGNLSSLFSSMYGNKSNCTVYSFNYRVSSFTYYHSGKWTLTWLAWSSELLFNPGNCILFEEMNISDGLSFLYLVYKSLFLFHLMFIDLYFIGAKKLSPSVGSARIRDFYSIVEASSYFWKKGRASELSCYRKEPFCVRKGEAFFFQVA